MGFADNLFFYLDFSTTNSILNESIHYHLFGCGISTDIHNPCPLTVIQVVGVHYLSTIRVHSPSSFEGGNLCRSGDKHPRMLVNWPLIRFVLTMRCVDLLQPQHSSNPLPP